MMLSNEKYYGDITLMKTVSSGRIGSKRVPHDGRADKFMVMANHPPIIEKETFDLIQKEKARRSNVEMTAQGARRKSARYSARLTTSDLST